MIMKKKLFTARIVSIKQSKTALVFPPEVQPPQNTFSTGSPWLHAA